MWWWEQEGIDLEGAREAAAAVAEEEGREDRQGGREKDSWTGTTVEKVQYSETN